MLETLEVQEPDSEHCACPLCGADEPISSRYGSGVFQVVRCRRCGVWYLSPRLTETVMEALYCGPTDTTRRIVRVGKPIDCAARIVDAGGRDAGPGETGELWLRGENNMRGYFDEPDATAAVFRGGWLLTGDLAVQDEDGF